MSPVKRVGGPSMNLDRCASDVLVDAYIEIDLEARAGPLISRP
jgi:hypothetical protein